MVKIRDITDSNGALASREPGLTAVFAGATAAIGYNTLLQLATLANSPKVYIIGRSRAKFQSQLDTLQEIDPGGTFIFLEAQIALLKEVKKLCAEILSKEEKLDILCMSPGYLSLKKTRDGRRFNFSAITGQRSGI
jgi:NADP-dependent 3-hydroxy acid dehydrogenase YdfG